MSQQTHVDPLIIAWDVRCSSKAELRDVQAVLHRLSKPTAGFEDAKSAHVNGKHSTRRTKHRFSTYFTDVGLLPGTEPHSFRIVFHRREHADRFWKDAMVRFLSELREAGTEVEIGREEAVKPS